MNRHRLKSQLREWQIIARDYRWQYRGPGKKDTVLIMVLDGSLQHGGFVDRLKGIVSFYALAKRYGWSFQIHYSNPFSLIDFFQENELNWHCSEVDKTWPCAQPTWEFDRNKVDLQHLVNRFSRGGVHHVYSNVDFVSQVWPLGNRHEQGHQWSTLFHELFKVAPAVTNQLALHLSNANRIGLHLRFTNLLGDFQDTGRQILSKQQMENLVNTCLTGIERVLSRKLGSSAFLFTDSVTFLEMATLRFPQLITIPGLPVHTDLTKGHQFTGGHEKTVYDFVALTQMEEIYFLKAKPMYDSKFSKYAAWVGGARFYYQSI